MKRKRTVKFYRTITLVILCTMYTATVFGSEKYNYPYLGLGVDVPEIIEGFRGGRDFYKQTAHVKPYPPPLRTLLQNPFTSFTEVLSRFTLGRSIGPIVRSFLGTGLTALEYSLGKYLRKENFAGMYLLSLYLVGRVVGRLSKFYTFITSPPQEIIIQKGDIFWVKGSMPIPCFPEFGNWYRLETRFLSNMKFRSRWASKAACPKDPDVRRDRNGKAYALENGKINIYLDEENFKLKRILGSLPTTKDVTAFDVFNDGKIVVTGGIDGIRKWELQRGEPLQKILEEE